MDVEKLRTIKRLAKEIQASSRGTAREKAEIIERLASELIKQIEELMILEMYL